MRLHAGRLVVFFIDGTLLNARCVPISRIIDDETLEVDTLKYGLAIVKRATNPPRPAMSWDFQA